MKVFVLLTATVFFVAPAVRADEGVAKPPVAKGAQTPAGGLPTTEEIRRSFDEGAYEQTIQLAAKALTQKGKAAEQYDRYSLLLLKADAHLKMKAASPAAQTYLDAATAAKDPHQQAVAHAMAMLLMKTKGVIYGPKPGKEKGAGVLDLSDPAQRPEALKRFWDERSARMTEIRKEMSDQHSLPQIYTAIEELQGLKDIEEAATGSQTQFGETVAALGGHAFKLMDRELNRFKKRTAELDKTASQETRTGSGTFRTGIDQFGVRITRRGLAPNETAELQGFLKDISSIVNASKEFGKAGDLKDNSTVLIEKANAVATSIENVIDSK